ncbi:unnamed protein product, partial [Rotaria sp. Silwood2]
YAEHFEKLFQHQYEIGHSLENVKSTNVAKFFAHLLATNAISWNVLRCIRVAADTTPRSNGYIKNLFLAVLDFLN